MCDLKQSIRDYGLLRLGYLEHLQLSGDRSGSNLHHDCSSRRRATETNEPRTKLLGVTVQNQTELPHHCLWCDVLFD